MPITLPAHHTAADLAWLQELLDDSHRRANPHLRMIHSEAARLRAEDVADRLAGMHVMVVATVSADGRPFSGPVDAFLHHGRVHFGTSPDALRARHLTERPQVSVTFADGEHTTLTVHGRARALDLTQRDRSFAERMLAHYGEGWNEWGAGAAYFAVEPSRVFAADMSAHTEGA